MSELKQLDQSVFDLPECPPDAESAAVDSDGEGYYYTTTKDGLTSDLTDFWIPEISDTKVNHQEIGGKFDATDWQNSAINRIRK